MNDPISVGPDPDEVDGTTPVDHDHGHNIVTRTWGAKTDSSADMLKKFPAPSHVLAGPSAGPHTNPLKGA